MTQLEFNWLTDREREQRWFTLAALIKSRIDFAQTRDTWDAQANKATASLIHAFTDIAKTR